MSTKVNIGCAMLLVACCLAASAASRKGESQQTSKSHAQRLEDQTAEFRALIASLDEKKAAEPNSAAELTQTPPQPTPAPAKEQTLSTMAKAAPPQETSGQEKPTEGSDQQQPKDEDKPRMDIYGFAMLDMGYDAGQNDPNWFDVMRPTKLPSFTDQFGHDGRFYSGVRQSRLGVKGYIPTDLGEIKTIFEFELFGTGVDAGQTTFRLRHAWGEIGQFGAGQTWSPFMDPDVFPNSIEYWGPNGMVFFRNVQVRWMPINKGNKQLWFALERPGASADGGVIADRIELRGITGRFPAPDISARLRWGGERGHVQLAGIGRYLAWDDANRSATLDLSGHTWGWGVNLSTNVPVAAKDVVRASVIYGHGVQNYMNDAPADVAPRLTANPRTPIDGVPLPVLGIVAFYDHYWSERWSSSMGWSMVDIDNVPLQAASEFRRGHYALANLLYYPVKNVMAGFEFQWGRRENNTDGFTFDDYRVQFSARYNFDFTLGGKK